MEWTDEALGAALTAYWGVGWASPLNYEFTQNRVKAMRDALDAAVLAQGLVDREGSKRFAIAHGNLRRAEALEEAAKVARRFTLMEKPPSHWPTELAEATAFICGKAGGQIANAIVALKDKPANQMDGGE